MSLEVGAELCVRAEVLSRHGDGVGLVRDPERGGSGRWEVHTPDLGPGEVACVRILHRSKQRPRAFAEVVEVLEPSAGRRAAPCPQRGTCTGCPLMFLDGPAQRDAKRVTLAERDGITVDRVVAGPADLGYRHSAKRVVGGRPGALVLGSWRRGSHEIADMAGCLVDHPDIVDAASELAAVASELEIEPYDEDDDAGDLRFVWLRTDGAGQVLVTLVTATPHSKAARELPGRLTLVSGIAWAVHVRPDNHMRGIALRPLWGRQSLSIAATGQRVGALGFLQPNPPVASQAHHDLVRVAAGGRVHGRRALDLYAGTGVTTRLLRESFADVVPCEAYPESARALGVPPTLAEQFLADQIAAGLGADLVVANPPRGGLGPAVCEQLCRLAAPHLHIMSCNPRSLQADLERLTGAEGAYKLVHARAYDTLPQTPHVEVVAWLVGR